MIEFTESLNKLESDFKNNGVPSDHPGFYDHPKFIDIERIHPEYLNNYARYVQQRPYEKDYLLKARKEIPVIAKALYNELISDGRQGACVDMSGVLSKILEREGFWNFAIKGSLTIQFPKKTGIGKRYFWSIDQGDFVAGHAWVYAPPFKIIDITIKQQLHKQGEAIYLPDYVLSDKPELSKPLTKDIISPEVRQYLQSMGIPEKKQLASVNPTMVKFLDVFKTYSVSDNSLILKYVPVAIGAPDCPLEEMAGISIEGKSAIEMYTQLVIPELTKCRA